MATYKIALTAGHYLYTAGKRCLKSLDPKETREWWLNDRIADKIEVKLQEYTGWDLLRTDDTTGKKAIKLKERVAMAEEFGADDYISLHHNAAGRKFSGGGIVAYVRAIPSAADLELQKDLYDALIAATGLEGNRSNPLPRTNLYECYKPSMAATLLELGFMDSTVDCPIILTEKYAEQCATAIVSVLVKRGKLTKKTTQTVQPEAPAAGKKTLYRVCKCWSNKFSERGQIWAGYNLDTAKKLCTGEYEVYDENGKVVYYVNKPKEETAKLDAARSFTKSLAGTYVVKSKVGLKLRTGAGTTKKILETMPDGSTVRCYGYHTNQWLYVVSASGKKGFCSKNYLVKK